MPQVKSDLLTAEARLTSPITIPGEDDPALRPRLLCDFSGQDRPRRLLGVYIDAARGRGEALDHTILFGQPGLGKTTLAHIVANEMGGGFRPTSAPAIQRPGDIAAILVSLEPQDILFIDEIHRLPPACEEILYGAMEDFSLDILVGGPGSSRAEKIGLPKFTLVGATTRSGMLTKPLRDRFGISLRLDLYSNDDLEKIVERSASLLRLLTAPGGVTAIAKRSRGTPRIANRLLRRVRDYAASEGAVILTNEVASAAFSLFEIDDNGHDELDRRYMDALSNRFRGGPVGLNTISSILGEDSRTIEDEVEPWLLKGQFIERTPRGRVLGAAADPAGRTGTLF